MRPIFSPFFGIDDARLIAPENPGLSLLPLRVIRRGPGQMPPLGTLYPEIEGVLLIQEWQRSLVESTGSE